MAYSDFTIEGLKQQFGLKLAEINGFTDAIALSNPNPLTASYASGESG